MKKDCPRDCGARRAAPGGDPPGAAAAAVAPGGDPPMMEEDMSDEDLLKISQKRKNIEGRGFYLWPDWTTFIVLNTTLIFLRGVVFSLWVLVITF